MRMITSMKKMSSLNKRKLRINNYLLVLKSPGTTPGFYIAVSNLLNSYHIGVSRHIQREPGAYNHLVTRFKGEDV